MPELLHLAIDTSASLPTAALLQGERALAEWLGPEGFRHHETLLAGIDSLLQQSGFSLSDLAYLSVGVGPGMFTGLRIGVTTAKFLADPLNIPCVPVSSLLSLAWQSQTVGQAPVWAISDARSRRVYALQVRSFLPDFSPPENEEVAISPEEAAARIQTGDVLIGEGAWMYRELWPAGARLLPEGAHALRGGAVGALGAQRYRLALTCTATELEPKYLKTGQPHL